MRDRVRQFLYGVAAAGIIAQFPLGATPASGQDATGGSDRPAVVPGNARASGATVGVGLRNGAQGGGLNIGVDMGTGLVTMKDTNAVSNATALDVTAAYQLFGPASACPGQPAVLSKRTPTAVASSQQPTDPGAGPVEIRYPGMNGLPDGDVVGTQVARATTRPEASGVAELPYQQYGVFTLYGGRSEVATTRYDGVRESRAVVSATALHVLGGLLIIDQPRWEAVARGGATESHTGSFTSKGGTLLGLPRSPDQVLTDLSNIGATLGWLLGSLGFQLDLPQVSVTTVQVPGAVQGETRVKVTPLTFRFTDPPIGAAAVQGLLEALKPWIDQTEADLAKVCENRMGLQIWDLVKDLASGTGTVSLYVGGVEAATDDAWFPTPVFDVGASPDTTDAPPTTESSVGADEGIAFEAAASGLGVARSTGAGPVSPSPGPDEPVVATTPAADAVATEVAGETQETARGPLEAAAIDFGDTGPTRTFRKGSTGGRGTWLGLLGLLGVGALAAGDRLVMKRTKRVIPG